MRMQSEESQSQRYILDGPFFVAFIDIITEVETRLVAAGVEIGEGSVKGSSRESCADSSAAYLNQ